MTNEQIKQNAEEYYQKLDSITIEDPREPNVNSIIDAYTAGAHSLDEEIKALKWKLAEKSGEVANAILDKKLFQDELNKLRNPWINVEEHPDDVTKDYLLEYEDGSHIVAIWDSGMWMSKNLHPLKKPTRWMPIP